MEKQKSTQAPVPTAEPHADDPSSRRRAALYVVLPDDPAAATAVVHEREAFRRAQGYVPAGTYKEKADAPGRPVLRRLLGRARTNAFDVVIVLALDDLGDTRPCALSVAVALADLGVAVVSADGMQLDLSARGLRWVAGEGERHSTRVRRGLRDKRARNERFGQVPLGYELAADGLHLQSNLREQQMIALCNRLASEGMKRNPIARALHDQGFRSRAGTMVTARQVGRILGRGRQAGEP